MNTHWLAGFGLWVASSGCFAEAVFSAGCDAVASSNALATATQNLQAQLATPEVELQLTPMGELPAMVRPQVRLLSQGIRSRVPVAFSGTVCGHDRPSVVTVWFKVQAWKQAWVYGRNGRADQVVTEVQPRLERVDLAAAQLSPNDLPNDVAGQWLNQSVNAGMPVLKRHLKAEPLVYRDAPVTVVVYGPGLMLRTEGKALRPGVLGERVPVMLDGAESSLLAVVAGKGEVHVER
ncbi:flagellar basal body P-ring formation chaperone FlgA [Pseudomonas sp. FW305-70]|jgi:flagella basal body P-ring formation protein FlgA|uniref:flagellar basal body P-ring formation chaperone FlgA n=1 Tax=Pseudomonas sp. FW305-70 TaxID=2751342 RepID=UPI000C88278C|nr:flagellar basal body P-ring formation chaperone FlgA [Pseudomonas sp. FW305-70]PMZ73750.1 flagella basal body P-ring formation protein FlgA [Pseudomonas sp. FW305-70]